MKSLRDLESVGWIFFVVVLVLLAYPGYYAARQLTDDTLTSPLVRIGFAAFMAAVGAGVVSWAVNEVLYRRHLRRHNERRKAEKKKKRAKKKKK